MSKKTLLPPWPKDEDGKYIKETPTAVESPPSTPSDLSIDDEMDKGLLAIHRLMKQVNEDVVARVKPKDTVVILKACMDMLRDLKKAETDLLDKLSDEELQEFLQKRANK